MSLLKGKKIAIIGGGGFIGHNMALSFSNSGAEVSCIDGMQVNHILSFSSTSSSSKGQKKYRDMLNERIDLLHQKQIRLIIEDARNYHELSKVIDQIKPDVIVHLAAVSNANVSNKDPHSTFDHSLRTLENALDCARGSKVGHFVFFSSSMVYGNFTEGIVDEKTVCDPIGIYGALKFAGEKIVKAYEQVFDLPVTIIRPSALYGERCVSRRVSQIFIENALTGQDIIIHGDGSDKLDFTYIQDLIHGVECVITKEASKGEIFNLTYGASRSLAEMADLIRKHFPNVKVEYKQKDKLTPDRGTLCVDKAKELIGYHPDYPLEKGYEHYINWYKNFWDK